MSGKQRKRCTGCGEVKRLTEYHRDARRKDGRKSSCRACEATYQHAYSRSHREEIAAKNRAYAPVYREAHKEEIVVRERAYRETHKAEIAAKNRSYREANREELDAYNRAYHEAHREEIVARKRAYLQTRRGRAGSLADSSRRRARPGGQELTAGVMQEVQSAAGGICCYCGEPFDDGHIDHIIPVSKGGTNDRENLVYCCAFCNMSKGAKLLEDWLV